MSEKEIIRYVKDNIKDLAVKYGVDSVLYVKYEEGKVSVLAHHSLGCSEKSVLDSIKGKDLNESFMIPLYAFFLNEKENNAGICS